MQKTYVSFLGPKVKLFSTSFSSMFKVKVEDARVYRSKWMCQKQLFLQQNDKNAIAALKAYLKSKDSPRNMYKPFMKLDLIKYHI